LLARGKGKKTGGEPESALQNKKEFGEKRREYNLEKRIQKIG